MKPLPLNGKPYYNASDVANSIAPDDIDNCYLEVSPELGLVTRRRPGLRLFADLGATAGDGLFYWASANKTIAVNSGNIYELNRDGTFLDITAATLKTGIPVSFSAGQKLDGTPWLYMANGALVYSENGSETIAPADVATPNTADQVAWLNGRFLANVPAENRFLFTDTNPATGVIENDFWSSSDNPLTTEAKGDELVALFVAWQEINAWGQEGLEIWQDDGVTPFSPLPGGFTEVGIEAKYSVARMGNTLFALCTVDGKRAVVKMAGRAPIVVSLAIENVINEYETVSDCIGSVVGVDGLAIYLLQFPSEGKTWAYDVKSDTWIPWSTWDLSTGTAGQFIGTHTCFSRNWNKHLVMSNVDGKIYEFDRSVFKDGTAPIKTYRRTPWIEHATLNRKRCEQLQIKIKKGLTDDVSCFVRFADNGAEEWSLPFELDLGNTGERDFVSSISRMGMYTSRRYEFTITDDTDLVLVVAGENVKELWS
jgi:hypothetical protein